jgi:hypothetical protein
VDDKVRQDWKKSSYLFREYVIPLLTTYLQRGYVVLAEDVDERRDFAAQLDQLAGIDAWHIIPDHAMRGIASRVQEMDSYDTFTIRWQRNNGKETERHKRLRAIHERHEGWLLPHLTCHAYVTPRVIRVGVIPTERLFLEVEAYVAVHGEDNLTSSRRPIRKLSTTNASFMAVRWDWERISKDIVILERQRDGANNERL